MDTAIAAQIVELSQYGEDGQRVANDLAASHGIPSYERHIKRVITRQRVTAAYGKEFCDLHIEIRPDGELSVTGTTGYVVSPKQAKRQALEFMISYFEESEENLAEFNDRSRRNFRSPERAARYVLSVDGDYSGLDVVREDDKEVFVATSCGMLRDDLVEFFPEVVPLFDWHLNHMKSNCVHQEARGEEWANEEHRGAVCPDCGFKLGSGWNKRALPPEIIKLALEIK